MFTRPFDRYALVPAPRSTPEILANSKCTEMPRRCEFCASDSPNYDSDTDLELHKQRDHRKEILALFEKNKHVCRTCLKKNADKASLLKHFKTSHLLCDSKETRIQRDAYICDICHRLFFSKVMLAYHLHHKHKFRTPEIECPKCEKHVRFGSSYIHFQGHLLGSIFCCPLCFIKFETRTTLQCHVQSYHAYSYKCNMCNYESKDHSNLVFHMEKVHERTSIEGIDPMAVKKCFIEAGDDKFVRYVPALATKGLSLKGIANLCILCREICATEQDMRDHYSTTHVATKATDFKKKYTCFCGEVFFNNVLLKHHVFKLKEPHRILKDGEVTDDCDNIEMFVEWLSDGEEETVGEETGETTCGNQETAGDVPTSCSDKERL